MPHPTTAVTPGNEPREQTIILRKKPHLRAAPRAGSSIWRDSITGDVFRSLKRAARPVDFDGLGSGFRAEAEVHARVRPRLGRKVGPKYSNYLEGSIRMLGNG